MFGNIKPNHGFGRLLLRGLEKVETETGLLAIAHNLRKKAKVAAQKAAALLNAPFYSATHAMAA